MTIHIESSSIDGDEMTIMFMRVIRDDDPASQRVFDAIKAAIEDALNGPRIEFEARTGQFVQYLDPVSE